MEAQKSWGHVGATESNILSPLYLPCRNSERSHSECQKGWGVEGMELAECLVQTHVGCPECGTHKNSLRRLLVHAVGLGGWVWVRVGSGGGPGSSHPASS